MFTIDQLVRPAETVMPLVREWIAGSDHVCEILPPSDRRAEVLTAMQITTRSPLGAIVYETGGLFIENGWLRFPGSGHPRLTRDLPSWNKVRSGRFLLVADDAVGGFFAMNGGELGPDMSSMYYWAPDNLDWVALEIGFPEFLHWAFSPMLNEFYTRLRWPSWKDDVAGLSGDECFLFDPFLWTKEGSIATSRRVRTSIAEAFAVKESAAAD